MTSGAWQFLGVIATGLVMLGIAFGGWIAARGSQKASPYDVLERRVVRLETRLETVEGEKDTLKREMTAVIKDRDALVAYIQLMQAWIASGAKPPAPTLPRHLADVVPPWSPDDTLQNEEARP